MHPTEEILKAVAMAQGAFAFGITLVVFYYYFKPFRNITAMRQHILLVSLSYLMLTAATMTSIFRGKYDLQDWWNYLVLSAYLIGDVSLFVLFKEILKR